MDEEGNTLKLATYRYPSKGNPKAIVLIFHGLNAHIGHSAHIAHQYS